MKKNVRIMFIIIIIKPLFLTSGTNNSDIPFVTTREPIRTLRNNNNIQIIT